MKHPRSPISCLLILVTIGKVIVISLRWTKKNMKTLVQTRNEPYQPSFHLLPPKRMLMVLNTSNKPATERLPRVTHVILLIGITKKESIGSLVRVIPNDVLSPLSHIL